MFIISENGLFVIATKRFMGQKILILFSYLRTPECLQLFLLTLIVHCGKLETFPFRIEITFLPFR